MRIDSAPGDVVVVLTRSGRLVVESPYSEQIEGMDRAAVLRRVESAIHRELARTEELAGENRTLDSVVVRVRPPPPDPGRVSG